jgi:hypothetical protein
VLKNKSINIGFLNVSGLLKRKNYPDFVDYITSYDIFCIAETHLDDTDIVDIPGYIFLAKHRKQSYKRKSGGIGMYIKENLSPFVDFVESNSEYALWIKIKQEFTHLDEPIVLCSVYIPPENSRFLNEDCISELENEISFNCSNYKYVFLTGDTNGRIGRLNDFISTDPHFIEMFDIDIELQAQLNQYAILENLSVPLERCSLDHKTNVNGLRLIQICRNNNLFLFNGRLFKDKSKGSFTFRNKSVIDYVMATAACFKYISDFEIIETDSLFSDGHNALHWTIQIPETRYNNENKQLHRNPLTWKTSLSANYVSNIDTNKINNLTEQLNILPVSLETIEYVTDELASIFSNAAEVTFPKRKQTSFSSNVNDKPWFGPKCNQARKNYHDAKGKYRSSPTPDNKTRLQNASKSYKRTMNYYIKKYKQTNKTKLRSLNEKNPKQYWKFLNNLKPKKIDKPSPSIHEFYEYFKNINENTINDNRFADIHPTEESNDFLNSPITENEIAKCISNLRNSKTPSQTDNILNEYIKSTKHILLPFYCKLFNIILDTGFIPSSWLEGTIIPLFKNKGDPKCPTSYRPITILSCLGKLFTAVLNQRLTTYLEENDILDENQAGFRKGYSCSDHIFTLNSLIEILKKRKLKLYCIFVDFSQAFDKVWRVGLWHKLLNSSVNGKFFAVINNMYKNIKSCISHNGTFSQTFISEIGVRQGENLSPVLFSLFLNDLQANMHLNGAVGIELEDTNDLTLWLKLLILLYADDTIIVSDNPVDFQNSLNIFYRYCNDWHLKVNINKTKVVVFGARQTQNYNFMLGDETIVSTDQYHYLGVTFANNGSFLRARKHVVEQATKAMHLLFTRSQNADLPIDLTIKLFDHTVLPILTYGSEIFGYENLDLLEKVHNEFLRKLTKARRSTPMSFLYGELGRYPISITVQTRMISYWNRLLTGKDNKISLQIYKYMINQTNNDYKWPNKIKEILFSVGRPDLWENQFQIRNKNIHKHIRQILIDQFKQKWHDELQQSNKGRIYCSFKENHCYESYFNELEEHEYISLFKFRTANHLLPVETGRHDGTPFQERRCTLCNRDDQIGCENHYLLYCNFFQSERDVFLSHLNNQVRDLSLKTLLSSKSLPVLKLVSKFVQTIMKKFQR